MVNKIKLILATIIALLAAISIPQIFRHLNVEWPIFAGIVGTLSLMLVIGFILSIVLSQIMGRTIARSVTNQILDKIEEGLMTAIETDHRLSLFEMKAVKGLITKTLQKDLPNALIVPLLIFYILGMTSLVLEMVYLQIVYPQCF